MNKIQTEELQNITVILSTEEVVSVDDVEDMIQDDLVDDLVDD